MWHGITRSKNLFPRRIKDAWQKNEVCYTRFHENFGNEQAGINLTFETGLAGLQRLSRL